MNVSKGNIMCAYKSIVVHRKLLSIPAYAILPPHTSEIKRVQRRNYVRVQTEIDVVIHGGDKELVLFTIVSLDISGGGIACYIPGHIVLDKNELISLYLVLPGIHSIYMQVKASIVQIHLLRMNQLMASMEFTQITPVDQQAIIRYVFDIQRKQLEKH